MSLKSRLRPDWRNPDIGRGAHVKSRPLLRYTSEEARLLEDHLIAVCNAEGLSLRSRSQTTTVVGDGTSTKSKRTWAAILAALTTPKTALEISSLSGFSDCAVRKNLRKMAEAGHVKVHSNVLKGKVRVAYWEATG